MTMPVPADRRPSTDGPAHTGPDHDEGLVAGLAAGDLDPREADEARALVAACPACARLETDVRSIMAATTALPVPQRSRDFRLTEADAARLRPSGWRRILEPFARPRLAFTRPLAGGLVTLGIAGLILASIPTGAAPAGEATTAGDAAGPAAPALSGESGQIFAPASAYSNLAVPASAGPSQPQPAASDNRAAAGPVASSAPNVPPAGAAGSPSRRRLRLERPPWSLPDRGCRCSPSARSSCSPSGSDCSSCAGRPRRGSARPAAEQAGLPGSAAARAADRSTDVADHDRHDRDQVELAKEPFRHRDHLAQRGRR